MIDFDVVTGPVPNPPQAEAKPKPPERAAADSVPGAAVATPEEKPPRRSETRTR